MRFVELKSIEGPTVIVNVDKIIAITDSVHGGAALILIDNKLDVVEKPNEIILKIRG
jgi:hypothetical protein